MGKLLGCDPELLLVDQNGHVRAADAVASNQAFGYDGGNTAAELRPEPADTPDEMFANIRGVLAMGREQAVGQYKWFAGTGYSGNHPTGGHIHIGDAAMPSLFDAYIGLPLVALEPSDGREYRHENSGYGHWGDIREQAWGLEYRTPSSWLVSPATTRLAMSLSWLVSRDWAHLSVPSWSRFLSSTRKCSISAEDNDWLRFHARKALSALKTLPHYKTVQPAIEAWYFLADVLGDWQQDRDMRVTWGLKDTPKVGPTVKEAQAEVEAVSVDQGTSVKWSDDRHMPMIERSCGPIASENSQSLWAVGARQSRGSSLLLSPGLKKNPQVEHILQKLRLPYQLWRNFPSRNGELVIGLPFKMRETEPEQCARAVRMVSLAAFGRLS